VPLVADGSFFVDTLLLVSAAFEGELAYLLAFYKVDDILVHFRERGTKGGTGPAAGMLCTPNSATAKSHGWDRCNFPHRYNNEMTIQSCIYAFQCKVVDF